MACPGSKAASSWDESGGDGRSTRQASVPSLSQPQHAAKRRRIELPEPSAAPSPRAMVATPKDFGQTIVETTVHASLHAGQLHGPSLAPPALGDSQSGSDVRMHPRLSTGCVPGDHWHFTLALHNKSEMPISVRSVTITEVESTMSDLQEACLPRVNPSQLRAFPLMEWLPDGNREGKLILKSRNSFTACSFVLTPLTGRAQPRVLASWDYQVLPDEGPSDGHAGDDPGSVSCQVSALRPWM